MDQHSRNVEPSDSECSSLPYSVGNSDSDTESLVESVGSVEIESREESTRKPGALFRKLRKVTHKSGSKFLQFSKEMRGVPVEGAWGFIRNHRNLADLVPGIIEGLDYLEGNGGDGSVFVATYAPQYTKPGDDKYMVYKVEVRDDVSRMYAVRCVGGKPQQMYNLYMSFMKVMSHEVLGDSSSVIIWRVEYELRNPQRQIPEETKRTYPNTLDLIRDRYLSLNRVDRPPVSHVLQMTTNITKRLKMQARQQWRRAVHEQVQKDPSEQRKKSKAQLLLKDNKEDDGDGQKKLRRSTTSRIDQLLILGGDEGRDRMVDQKVKSEAKEESIQQIARKKSGLAVRINEGEVPSIDAIREAQQVGNEIVRFVEEIQKMPVCNLLQSSERS